MNLAKIQVSGAQATVLSRTDIPAGIAGATIEIEYTDSIWAGLNKAIVFRGSSDVEVLTNQTTVAVPPEVVKHPGIRLRVGVYGTDAEENVVMPTLWANLGVISDSTGTAVTVNSSLPVWAQLWGMIGNLDNLNTTAKNNLVAALNELAAKIGNTDPAQIKEIVEDYLKENMPEVDLSGVVKSVNGVKPDPITGDVAIEVSGGNADYVLPVGGEELGGVKNGGNVVINEDGTMTAPESTGGTGDYTKLTNKPKINGVELSGEKSLEDLGIGQPTAEQVGAAVSAYLDEHPEVTTTIADGAVTPNKTSFLREESTNINLYDQTQTSNVSSKIDVAGLSKIYYRFHPNGSGCNNNAVAAYSISKAVFYSEADAEVSSKAGPMGTSSQTDGVFTVVGSLDVPDGASYVVFNFNNYYNGNGWSTMIVTDREIQSDADAEVYTFEIVGEYKERIAKEVTETEVFAEEVGEFIAKSDARTDEKVADLREVSVTTDASTTENILDYTDTVPGLVTYNEANGIRYETNTTSLPWAKGMVSTKPLPCEGSTTYYLTNFSDADIRVSMSNLVELDENMEVVKYTTTSSAMWPFTTQETTRYMIASFLEECLTGVVIAKRGVTQYFPAIKKTIPNNTYIPAAQVISGLSGLKWNALGDSWTADGGTHGTYKGYVARIADKTGMIARNYGIGSSTISEMNGGGYEPMCVRYADMDNDADLVTVMGGINDHTAVITAIDYGDIDSTDTATFYGGWNVLLSGLRTKYPKAIILVFTNGDCTPQTRGDAEGRVEAIKKVCAKHRIPCCDILHNLGYGFKDYETDMVHLKATQIEKNLTPLVYNFIKQHFML